jgi:hypothetical protein
MKKNIKYFLYFWMVVNVLFFILAFKNVYNSDETVTLIYIWGSAIGAFVWEDLLVFSLFNIVVPIIIILLKDNRYTLLFPLFFWLVRSLGETLYWFLQQFNQPTVYPHDQYNWNEMSLLRNIFGEISNQKYFILFQICWQCITTLTLVGIVYVFKNWKKVGEKVNSL